MSHDNESQLLSKVLQINDARIQDHLGKPV